MKITSFGIMCLKFSVWLVLIGNYSVVFADNTHSPINWDLSYHPLFKEKAPKNDTVAKFFRDSAEKKGQLAQYALPPEFFQSDRMANAEIAVLVDYQAFWYFGHRTAALYVKTARGASMHHYNSKSGRVESTEARPDKVVALYDKLLAAGPTKPTFEFPFKTPAGFVYSGYGGAVSLYRLGESKQFLITPEDIVHKDFQLGRVQEIIRGTVGR